MVLLSLVNKALNKKLCWLCLICATKIIFNISAIATSRLQDNWIHCELNKMWHISQRTCKNEFLWQKSLACWSKFHWSFHLYVILTTLSVQWMVYCGLPINWCTHLALRPKYQTSSITLPSVLSDSHDAPSEVNTLLTHWPLGDLDVILKIRFSILFYWLVSWDLCMIMPSDECHRTLLMISQHWFR